ncbi:DUF1573 domain-containing protein [Candidatus Microgenomates bacterium]|nr:DUF1573 domain-containing protein [Candidatus Microgenomates bacterium]
MKISGEKAVFVIIGGLTLLVLLVIVLFSLTEQQGKGRQVTQYVKSDSSRPKANVASFSSDLGKMKVSDEKSAEFTIENNGNKPLSLFKISTSCDCTFATVTINNVKSEEFSMHGKSSWTGEVKAGEKATVTVIYKPSIMPVSGPVSREVYVGTNDPDRPKLTFTISAFVE